MDRLSLLINCLKDWENCKTDSIGLTNGNGGPIRHGQALLFFCFIDEKKF